MKTVKLPNCFGKPEKPLKFSGKTKKSPCTSFETGVTRNSSSFHVVMKSASRSPVHKLFVNFSATLGFSSNFELVEQLLMHLATLSFVSR